jgi:mono/diheme cytochrome c family protein
MRTLRWVLPLWSSSRLVPAPRTRGSGLYLRYCASCHGREGRGDGSVAPALGERPTDLTQIAAVNGGDFPFVAVAEAIDGTRSPRAHGVSEMPIWPETFRIDPGSPLEQQLMAGGRIVVIRRYYEKGAVQAACLARVTV